jgi:hypothetical protein
MKTRVKIVRGRYKNYSGWIAGSEEDFRKRCKRGDTKSIVNIDVIDMPTGKQYSIGEIIEHICMEMGQMQLPLEDLNTSYTTMEETKPNGRKIYKNGYQYIRKNSLKRRIGPP